MSKIKVILDTESSINEFVGLASSINEPVFLEDGNGLRVNAKSLMGVLYGTSEFSTLYVISENENIASKFMKFIV